MKNLIIFILSGIFFMAGFILVEPNRDSPELKKAKFNCSMECRSKLGTVYFASEAQCICQPCVSKYGCK